MRLEMKRSTKDSQPPSPKPKTMADGDGDWEWEHQVVQPQKEGERKKNDLTVLIRILIPSLAPPRPFHHPSVPHSLSWFWSMDLDGWWIPQFAIYNGPSGAQSQSSLPNAIWISNGRARIQRPNSILEIEILRIHSGLSALTINSLSMRSENSHNLAKV
jgi:hypothetical protein